MAHFSSAPASGAGGRWFETSHPDQYLHESDLPGVALVFCASGPHCTATRVCTAGSRPCPLNTLNKQQPGILQVTADVA